MLIQGSGTISPTSPKDLTVMTKNFIDFGQDVIVPPEVVNSNGELAEDFIEAITKEARGEDHRFAKHDINKNYDFGTEKGIGHRQIDRCFSTGSDDMRKPKGNAKIATDVIAPQSFDSLVKVMQDESKSEAGTFSWRDQNKAATFDARQVKKRPDPAHMLCSNGRPQHYENRVSTNDKPELWSNHASQFIASEAKIYETTDEMKNALPEQTIVALSENLPWDPEESLTVSAHSKNTKPRNQAVASFEIPKVREQLVPDVRLGNDVIKQSWEKAPVECTSEVGRSYNSSFLSENSVRVDRLSPNMAEIGRGSYSLEVNEGSRNSAFDRRKQRTMRRIDWGTNYIPPLDCQPQMISPMIKRAVLRPVRKETSV